MVMASESFDHALADETATERLAARLAGLARPGDVVTLSGALGAGKTSLARAFIRARARLPDLDVPSPTFALVQHYDLADGAVWHLDLYRLNRPEELRELGLEEAGQDITLVEWPDRMGAHPPAERLDIALAPGEG